MKPAEGGEVNDFGRSRVGHIEGDLGKFAGRVIAKAPTDTSAPGRRKRLGARRCSDQPGSADVGVVVISGSADGVSGAGGGVVGVVVTAVLASGGTGASVAGDSDVGKGSTGVAGSDTRELVLPVNATPSAPKATIALPPTTAATRFTRAGLLLFEFTSDRSDPVLVCQGRRIIAPVAHWLTRFPGVKRSAVQV
jgi:hypothetical protein